MLQRAAVIHGAVYRWTVYEELGVPIRDSADTCSHGRRSTAPEISVTVLSHM